MTDDSHCHCQFNVNCQSIPKIQLYRIYATQENVTKIKTRKKARENIESILSYLVVHVEQGLDVVFVEFLRRDGSNAVVGLVLVVIGPGEGVVGDSQADAYYPVDVTHLFLDEAADVGVAAPFDDQLAQGLGVLAQLNKIG